MGSKAKAASGGSGGDKTKKQTPAEQIRDNFLQFTSGRPNIMSDSIVFQRPDGKLEGVNVNFDPFMSELLAGARSGKNVGPPSQTMPPVMFKAPPSQTMPPVFRAPQASPNELFKDSVLRTLETVQLPPSVRDESIPLPGIDLRERFRGLETPEAFKPLPPPTTPSGLLPSMVPLPVGIGSLFREFLESLQEDD